MKTTFRTLDTQEDDDWSDITSKAERKKRQNRLNQRAKRRRDAAKIPTLSPTTPAPVNGYMQFRFRKRPQPPKQSEDPGIDDTDQVDTAIGALNNTEAIFNSSRSIEYDLLANPTLGKAIIAHVERHLKGYFPMSSDHLLHLVQLNTFRGLLLNKSVTESKANTIQKKEHVGIAYVPICTPFTILAYSPDTIQMPRALLPTRIQQTIPHPGWMDMMPCPRLRDNMIMALESFNQLDFICDALGDLVTRESLCPKMIGALEPSKLSDSPISTLIPASSSSNDSSMEVWYPDDDSKLWNCKGIIVWGEPWDTSSWELTPRFIRKWSWILEGCEELIGSTNKWRAARGDDPIRLDLSF